MTDLLSLTLLHMLEGIAPVRLDELEAKDLISRYGIGIPRRYSLKEFTKHVKTLHPDNRWVCKLVHRDIAHKSERGYVRMDLLSADVASAAAELARFEQLAGLVDASVIIEEQHFGYEFLVGIVQTDLGRLLSVGLGGVQAESIGRVASRLLPVNATTIMSMIEEIGGLTFRHVLGWEGEVSQRALLEVISKLCEMAEDQRGVAEVELNPVLVHKNQAIAVDALVTMESDGQEQAVLRSKARPVSGLPEYRPGDVDWERLFSPTRVVAVGATTGRYNRGREWLRFAAENGFPGELIAVSRKPSIDSFRTVSDLSTIAEPIDLVMSEVPATASLDIVRTAVELRIPWVCVRAPEVYLDVGSGKGNNVVSLTEALREITDGTATRVVGPGALGPLVPRSCIGPPGSVVRVGPAGILAQSGVIFLELSRALARRNIGVHTALAFGSSDLMGVHEYVDVLDRRISGGPLLIHLEGVRQGEQLVAALRSRTSRDAAILLKGGTTVAGRKAVASHTGAMTGSSTAWRSLELEGTVHLVKSIDSAADALAWLQILPEQTEPELVILTPSGGQGVLWSDACELADVRLASEAISIEDQDGVKLPPGVSLSNPIDLGNAYLQKETVRLLLTALEDKPARQRIAMFHVASSFIRATAEHRPQLVEEFLDVLGEANDDRKPNLRLVAVLPYLDDDGYRSELERGLLARGVPVFADGHRAIESLGGVLRARRRLSYRQSVPEEQH